jgi:hypothetical protein
MNKYLKTAVLLLVFAQVFAQISVQKPQDLLMPTKKWILSNNKIEKNEVYLSAYKASKLRANTFVMNFIAGGKIEYDYETNVAFKTDSRIQFLDLNTEESAWEYDTLNNQLVLTIKGGYSSLEDFKFKRSYTVVHTADGYVLRKASEEFYEDLKQKARQEKLQLAQAQKGLVIVEKPQPIIVQNQPVIQSSSTETIIAKETNASPIVPVVVSSPPVVEEKVVPITVIDYAARSRNLLDKSKRWMLVKNKIERNDIFLKTYDESKLTINNLILSFDEGKITYDYESDPKIKFCAGVDFLDIDTDETTWEYNAERNIVTLTLKGGYASLDDFKFKREYWVESVEDGYILRKLKEHFFTDFRKPAKKSKK